jgi:hypothetical protein
LPNGEGAEYLMFQMAKGLLPKGDGEGVAPVPNTPVLPNGENTIIFEVPNEEGADVPRALVAEVVVPLPNGVDKRKKNKRKCIVRSFLRHIRYFKVPGLGFQICGIQIINICGRPL